MKKFEVVLFKDRPYSATIFVEAEDECDAYDLARDVPEESIEWDVGYDEITVDSVEEVIDAN